MKQGIIIGLVMYESVVYENRVKTCSPLAWSGRSIASSILCSDVEVELSQIDQTGHGFFCYLHLCQRCCVVMGRLGGGGEKEEKEEGGNRGEGREGGADERLSYMHARLHKFFK